MAPPILTRKRMSHDPERTQLLTRLLLYGNSRSRVAAAVALSREGDEASWRMLVSTVRSSEPWLLRARALETLALLIGEADQHQAERILSSLLAGDAGPDQAFGMK
jgi:HEAT repeat protein